ncbi:hypothetical protein OPV22_003231 [Ensete ventricosum]|uniref:CSD domain-containing protein n=1 Tax=Ensete ventricosum TaxID=4639 RepID=A0AAV8S0A2_ENSVE|nr:hypothetical protein OPV22_003231 [Ensete ventricosum]
MDQANDRSRGTVKWFNNTKGFGFISPDDGGEDLFVHQSSIKAEGYRTLTEGEIVEFMVTEGDDGRIKAVDVTGPDGSNVQGGGGDGRREGFGGGRGGGFWGGGYGVAVAVLLAITVVRWDILPEIAPREEAVAAEGTVGEAVGMTGLATIVVRWGTLLGNALARSEAESLPGFASFLFAHPT